MATKEFGVDAWLARTAAEIRSGEFLMAYDLAIRGLEAYPESDLLKFHAVLALARSGATERAEELYGAFELHKAGTEDTSSLGARIAKDKFFAGAGRANQEDSSKAAQLYQEVFENSGGYYPAINAATMWFFSGDTANCTKMAALAHERSLTAEPDGPQAHYWQAATRAEALLLLEQLEDAQSAINEAAIHIDGDYSAAASTRSQLLRICAAMDLDTGLLDPLKPPSIVYYSGHMIARAGRSGQFGIESEELVQREIGKLLKKDRVGFGFGSLACGSDILFAEALLAHGAELHVVIPFDLKEFTEISVSCGGPGWKERMDDCLARATSVTHATTGAYLGDDSLFNYAARMAMGFARIKAQNLSADLKMLAVWNGEKPKFQAGTAVDVAFWRERNLDIETIDCGPPAKGRRKVAASAIQGKEHNLSRKIYPVAFADIKGFSKLSDNELARFFEKVMGLLGSVMDKYGDHVLFRNTWGDAVHAVFDDVTAAAKCALEMQGALHDLDGDAVSLPVRPEMRMALDVGPVFEGYDFIKKEATYFGSTLTRAARMEPVTPVREVFVTEAFAALSAMECTDEFRCEYVGHLPLAQAYGDQRMYLLRQNLASRFSDG
ncbi:MAG: adenylate/guanylate cyclase domain-containing protein [Hyphomicrobiaceae bacterium]|nr:adenylate/guanylate cyclase domain-containing protein [Hyphomicrobiaceae bacterium]